MKLYIYQTTGAEDVKSFCMSIESNSWSRTDCMDLVKLAEYARQAVRNFREQNRFAEVLVVLNPIADIEWYGEREPLLCSPLTPANRHIFWHEFRHILTSGERI